MLRPVSSPACALVLLLFGCGSPAVPVDTGGDVGSDNGYSSVETGSWVDSGAARDSGHTGDTGDGGGDGGAVGPTLTGLTLYPTRLVVIPGDSWVLRAVGGYDDGSLADVTPQFTSTDKAVLTVDAQGVVTAVGPGVASIEARIDVGTSGADEGGDTGATQLLASRSYEVSDGDAVMVTVVDAESGDPRPGARVRVGQAEAEGAEGSTGGEGRVSLSWPEAGPMVVSVWAHDRVPVTVFGQVGRELVIPLRLIDSLDEELGSVTGDVDLSGVPTGGVGDLKVGIALPSLVDGPLLIDTDRLAGPNRELSVFGVTANVPANIYVRDADETYALPAAEGQTGVWTLAAPMPIDDVTSGLAGATDALEMMLENLDEVAWGWNAGPVLAPGQTGVAHLSPSTALTEAWTVSMGDLPVGFGGEEDALVMVGDMLDAQGFSPVGIGVGTGDVQVFGADRDLGGSQRMAAVIAQVGGLGAGTGYGLCTSAAPLTGASVTLPALQRVPALHSFDPVTKAFSLETDPRARYVHAVVYGGGGGNQVRELYVDGAEQAHVLPDLGAPFGYGRTTWEILALETTTSTFQDFVRDGQLSGPDLATAALTAGLLTQEP